MSISPPADPSGGAGDRLLLERLRAGDRAALDEIVNANWFPLVTYIQSFLDAPDPAEDVAQETFLRLWRGRRRWDPAGTVNGLLYRIARNLAIDALRRRKVRHLWLSKHGGIHDSAPPTSPESDVEEMEISAAVIRAVERLPPRRREVFKLVRFSNLSYHNVAAALGVSEQTVANHMSAALADLRRDLRDFLPD